jgi:hypothetical protein
MKAWRYWRWKTLQVWVPSRSGSSAEIDQASTAKTTRPGRGESQRRTGLLGDAHGGSEIC